MWPIQTDTLPKFLRLSTVALLKLRVTKITIALSTVVRSLLGSSKRTPT